MSKAKFSLPTFFKLAFAALLFFFDLSISAGNNSSPAPISDEEISERKQHCYGDIDGGLWGAWCRSSLIEKENCALKCVSPICYELIYESDPLEEGERDYIRSQEFRYCMRRSSVGLKLDQVKGAFDNDVTVRATAFSLPELEVEEADEQQHGGCFLGAEPMVRFTVPKVKLKVAGTWVGKLRRWSDGLVEKLGCLAAMASSVGQLL